MHSLQVTAMKLTDCNFIAPNFTKFLQIVIKIVIIDMDEASYLFGEWKTKPYLKRTVSAGVADLILQHHCSTSKPSAKSKAILSIPISMHTLVNRMIR